MKRLSSRLISSSRTLLWLPRWLSGKESARQCTRLGFHPWVRKIPWRRAWQPTPIFLPGESHGQRSLEGYSPRGRKESDTLKRRTTHRTHELSPQVNELNTHDLTSATISFASLPWMRTLETCPLSTLQAHSTDGTVLPKVTTLSSASPELAHLA